MRIRKLTTRKVKGRVYTSHRLAHSVRVCNAVDQVTLMNLGAHYAVSKEDWPLLCQCIMNRLQGKLMLPLMDDHFKTEADRIWRVLTTEQEDQLIRVRLIWSDDPQWRTVDVHTQEQINSRSVGVEQVALWALSEIGFFALSLLQIRSFVRGSMKNYLL